VNDLLLILRLSVIIIFIDWLLDCIN